MQPPVHPLDRALSELRWQRLRLDDLKGESSKIPARFICKSANFGGDGISIIAALDVFTWVEGDKTRMELGTPNYPRIFERLVVAGLKGSHPLSMGFTPCQHEPWHWNPLCLPLRWEESMNDMEAFKALLLRYKRLLDDENNLWQCPSYRGLAR